MQMLSLNLPQVCLRHCEIKKQSCKNCMCCMFGSWWITDPFLHPAMRKCVHPEVQFQYSFYISFKFNSLCWQGSHGLRAVFHQRHWLLFLLQLPRRSNASRAILCNLLQEKWGYNTVEAAKWDHFGKKVK